MNIEKIVEPDSLWTVKDVAQFLKVSRNWVYTRVAAGQLPCLRFGAMVRFDPARIRALIQGTVPQLCEVTGSSQTGDQ